jgi:hypothetical protein
MDKAQQFREHAETCRRLASGMDRGDYRDQLLTMAESWEDLAKDRARRKSSAAPSHGESPSPDSSKKP